MPLPRTTVSGNGFLNFPRLFFFLLTGTLPTKPIFLVHTTRNICTTTKKLRQIQSSLSTSNENQQKPFYNPTSNSARFDLQVEPLHAQAIKCGSMGHRLAVNHLLSLYVKCCNLDQAQRLFDEIPVRDVRMWTILIVGFSQLGMSRMALELFIQMQIEGICPNRFTFSSILKCCASDNNLRMGKEIHGWIQRNMIGLDVVLENSIVDLYAKCGAFGYARRVFELMPKKDTVSWNIMIGAYLEIGDTEKSIELFRRLPFKDVASWNTIIVGQIRNGSHSMALELLYEMGEIGLEFSKLTFSIVLLLAASLSILDLGRQIHGRVLRIGFDQDGYIRNSLIDMYCKCGKPENASAVFDKTERDSENMQNSTVCHYQPMVTTISWSSIVSGYVQNGRTEKALELFCKMVCEGVKVDKFTITSMVSACADAGILELGRQIHTHIEKLGYELDVFLLSAIIGMYAKCGSLDDALAIFYQFHCRNIVLWTSVISGCALHGRGREAIRLFELMLKEGIRPNEISFIGVLSGCSHAGLVEEGRLYFRLMQEDYDIVPGVEHFTCMVDLLGRAGRLNEAMQFIQENGISHLGAVWRALLSACRIRKNIEMGKLASEQLLKLEPFDAGSYILSSNIDATTQKWEKAAETRSLMQERGVKKLAGQSWIQLKNRVYTFSMGDRSHPQAAEIYSFLEGLIGRLKEVGYSTNTDLVMHDVEEEQREGLLGLHSEKLAIAYGIMNMPSGSPIRVMKNLRVCSDCHTAIKYISQVTSREIIVRDAYRFHNFKHGQCSCGDYW